MKTLKNGTKIFPQFVFYCMKTENDCQAKDLGEHEIMKESELMKNRNRKTNDTSGQCPNE